MGYDMKKRLGASPEALVGWFPNLVGCPVAGAVALVASESLLVIYYDLQAIVAQIHYAHVTGD